MEHSTLADQIYFEYLLLQRFLVLKVARIDRWLVRDKVGYQLLLTPLIVSQLASQPASEQLALLNSLKKLNRRWLIRWALFLHRLLAYNRTFRDFLITFFLYMKVMMRSPARILKLIEYNLWTKKFEKNEGKEPSANVPNLVQLVILESKNLTSLIRSVVHQDCNTQNLRIWIDDPDHRQINKLTKSFPHLQINRLDRDNWKTQLADIPYTLLVSAAGRFHQNALRSALRFFDSHSEFQCAFPDRDQILLGRWRRRAQFLPSWCIDYQYALNLLSPVFILKTDWLTHLNISWQDYWTSLLNEVYRLDEKTIGHIPQVLFHCSSNPTITKSSAWRNSLSRHLEACHSFTQISVGPLGLPRVQWEVPKKAPSVSVIIATRDKVDLLKRTIDGLLYRTDYPDFEILVIDNDSREEKTKRYLAAISKLARVRVYSYKLPFNFSSINNFGAQLSQSEILVFLNNDVDVINRGWLKEMVSQAIRPGVGAVGAKLFFRNGFIQHAGVISGIGQVSQHVHAYWSSNSPGYCNRLQFVQGFSIVTAACLAVRKDHFEKIGGFNEQNLAVAYNDVDLCLRLKYDLNLRNVWTPFAQLYHDESMSRSSDRNHHHLSRYEKEVRFMHERWGSLLNSDPYYNPNLSVQNGNFTLAYPPRVFEPSTHVAPKAGLPHDSLLPNLGAVKPPLDHATT